MADAAACSPYFLCRVFKKETGSTIHHYLQQLRLKHSLPLLLDALDITTIAHQLGFAHHSHFTSAFTRTYGITPSTFRRTYRAKI